MASYKHDPKAPGDVIQSSDWNAIGNKVQELSTKYDDAANTIKADLTVTGNLTTNKKATAGQGLRVQGKTELVGTLTASAPVSFASSLSTGGGARVGSDLAVMRNGNVSGSLSVGGNLTATGNASVRQSLTVQQNASIRGTATAANMIADTDLTVKRNAAVAGTMSAAKFVGDGIVPAGVIVMWSGASNQVPAGWAVCNGQTVNRRKTPDLRGRFILAADDGAHKPGARGGSHSHTLSLNEMPRHRHGGTTAAQSVNHRHSIRTKQDDWNVSGGSRSGGPSYGIDNGALQVTNYTDYSDARHGHGIAYEGGNAAHNNMPAYYVLVYIMKV